MIQVQATIEAKGKGAKISINLLEREDATPNERMLAECFNGLFRKHLEGLAEQTNTKLLVTEIKKEGK